MDNRSFQAPNRKLAGRLALRSTRGTLLFIGALAMVTGCLAGWLSFRLSHAASLEGLQIDTLFSTMLGIATFILVIVEATLVVAIVRFGRRSRRESEVSRQRENRPLEVFWTVVPFLIVTFLGIFSYVTLAAISRDDAHALVVQVRGWQWSWEFTYPEAGVTSRDLHLPVGRQVLFRMHSDDVIHSFWVPEFRVKRDLMPDRETELRVTPSRTGQFEVICSRFCGMGHADMRALVVVQTPDDFRAWLADQSAAQPQGQRPAGRQLFLEYGCSGCHTLTDAGADGKVGPNLDGIGTQAATRVPGRSAEQYIRESITEPNAYIVPGYSADVMPRDFRARMAPQEMDALVQYLLGQK